MSLKQLYKSQGLSQLYDHGPWLMCEVAMCVYYMNIEIVYNTYEMLVLAPSEKLLT
jgi:hypothetical protein